MGRRIDWYGAYTVFTIAAAIGLYVSWVSFERHHSLVLPVILFGTMFWQPLWIGRRAARNASQLSESSANKTSQLIAILVMLAYALFIYGMVFALATSARHAG